MADSPTVQRRRLGLLLRQLRGEADLTTRQAGARMDRPDSWVSRVETGETSIRIGELRAVLELYGVTNDDVRAEAEDLAKGGRQRGWWSRYRTSLPASYSAYIGFETSASRLLVYESLVVHGLLQTEDYARAVVHTGEPRLDEQTVGQRVQVRMTRQALLVREPDPLEIWVVLDEAVLRRVIGGDLDVHLAQLDHLLGVVRMPNVRLQVVPYYDAHASNPVAGFTVLEFARLGTIAYTEGITGEIFEEGEQAQAFMMRHNDLRAAALSEPRSAALIKEVRAEAAARKGAR